MQIVQRRIGTKTNLETGQVWYCHLTVALDGDQARLFESDHALDLIEEGSRGIVSWPAAQNRELVAGDSFTDIRGERTWTTLSKDVKIAGETAADQARRLSTQLAAG